MGIIYPMSGSGIMADEFATVATVTIPWDAEYVIEEMVAFPAEELMTTTEVPEALLTTTEAPEELMTTIEVPEALMTTTEVPEELMTTVEDPEVLYTTVKPADETPESMGHNVSEEAAESSESTTVPPGSVTEDTKPSLRAAPKGATSHVLTCLVGFIIA